MFQSTRPRGRTRPCVPVIRPLQSVSIHASSREDATRMGGCVFRRNRFNPRVLAGGRDLLRGSLQLLTPVSIHASSREDATFREKAAFRTGIVSIHASSREDATRDKPKERYSFTVSIHASSREDATSHCKSSAGSFCFNPRVLAGGRDPLTKASILTTMVSIHASSREDATISTPYKLSRHCFNPRVLAGGRDLLTKMRKRRPIVSIHASSREDATLSQIKRIGTAKFQSTRPRGRTRPYGHSRSNAGLRFYSIGNSFSAEWETVLAKIVTLMKTDYK